MASSRTVLEFESDADIWAVLEAWAQEAKYRQVDSGESWRRYQKGHGIIFASRMLEVHCENNNMVHLEAWVHSNIVARICALFLIPSDMGIESSWFVGKLPRSMARKEVNILLQRLGQQLFE